MKKTASLILTLTITLLFKINAQDDFPNARGRDKIKAAKVGLITNRLSLTEEQAKVFWVIYDEFDKKRSGNSQKYSPNDG